MTTLETERLLLRPHVMEDLDALHALLTGHPDVYRFDPGYARSLEESRAWLSYRIREFRMVGVGCFAVLLKDSQTLIGRCGLEAYLEDSIPSGQGPYNHFEVELYYHFGREYWGQGYATEAARAVIDYAFLDRKLPRLATVGVHRDNAESIKLLERVGMTVLPSPVEPDEVMGILENTLLRSV